MAVLDDLAEVAPGDEGLRTAGEIAETKGWGRKRVLDALHRAQRAGRLEVVTVQRMTLTGRLAPVPAYRVLAEKD